MSTRNNRKDRKVIRGADSFRMWNGKETPPGLSDVEELRVTPALIREVCEKRGLNPPEVRRLARRVRAYSFTYLSEGIPVRGFLVMPRGEMRRSPLVLYARGGFEEFSSIEPERVFGELARWASWGYVIAASNYRGSPGSGGRDEMGGADLVDVVSLKRLVCRHPAVDPARIGIIGHSRGGMMAYMLMARCRWLKTAIAIGASADLPRSVKLRPAMLSVYQRAFGGKVSEMRRRSGVYLVERFSKRCPLLMLHGSADWRVDPRDSLDMCERLIERHIPHRLMVFEGGDHNICEHRERVQSEIKEWLGRFLGAAPELPNMRPHGP